MCHTCKTGDGNTKGYPTGMKDLEGYGEIPLN